MREVRLIAVSDDGTHLILSGDDDERLALQVDETLHAAIRGDRARLGQLEIQVENQLRPRDIQARIRSGESVEGVAAVAGMPEEKVRRFAGPVLAEREHVAGRARQATIRRVNTDGPPRVLEEATVQSATASGAVAESVAWDAWRRDDGRWQVRCSWQAPGSDTETTAHFAFDPSGRSVLADDDAARFIAGDVEPEPERPAASPDVIEAVQDPDHHHIAADDVGDDQVSDAPPRLSVVPAAAEDPPSADEELQATLPEGVVGLDSSPAPADERNPRRSRRGGRENRRRDPALWATETPDATRPSASAPSSAPPSAPADVPAADVRPTGASTANETAANPAAADRTAGGSAARNTSVSHDPGTPAHPDVASDSGSAALDDDETPTDRLHLSDIADHVEEVPEKPAAPKSGKQAKTGSRSRRPSVPTWDEIMFGRSKSSE